jgi:hypothetical protein
MPRKPVYKKRPPLTQWDREVLMEQWEQIIKMTKYQAKVYKWCTGHSIEYEDLVQQGLLFIIERMHLWYPHRNGGAGIACYFRKGQRQAINTCASKAIGFEESGLLREWKPIPKIYKDDVVDTIQDSSVKLLENYIDIKKRIIQLPHLYQKIILYVAMNKRNPKYSSRPPTYKLAGFDTLSMWWKHRRRAWNWLNANLEGGPYTVYLENKDKHRILVERQDEKELRKAIRFGQQLGYMKV